MPPKSRNKSKSRSKQRQRSSSAPPQVLDSDYVEILFNSARCGNDDTIMHLFLRQLDLAVRNEDGNTALHVAAMNGHDKMCRMLVVLCAPVLIWKTVNNQGLTAEQLASKDKIREELHSLSHGTIRVEDEHTRWNDELSNALKEWGNQRYFMMAFDGGGVRGLIQTQILLHLERDIGSPLFPLLDWVAGTSCGGVLALLLSKGRSVDFCRRFMIEFKETVFCGAKSKIPKHDASGMESASKTVFGQDTMDTIQKKVLVTVADTLCSPIRLVLFRSFVPKVPEKVREHYQYLDPSKLPIWKAARCTTAAPFYFESFGGLSDGGLVANNPTQVLMCDFILANQLEKRNRQEESANSDILHSKDDVKEEPKEEEPRMGLILSLGTGRNPTEKSAGIDLKISTLFGVGKEKNPIQMVRNAVVNTKNMFNTLIKECTASNGLPVAYARDWCHSLAIPFFRLSPQLSKGVPLDATDIDTIIDFLWETEVYIHGEGREDLVHLARILKLKIESPPAPTQKDAHGVDSQSSTREPNSKRSVYSAE